MESLKGYNLTDILDEGEGQMQKAGKRQRTRDEPYTKFKAAVRAQNVRVAR